MNNGQPKDFEFGGAWDQDHYRLTLYGDVDACHFGDDHPDSLGYADHQKAAFYFKFQQIRPYGKMLELFKVISDFLQEKGWPLAAPIEGLLGSGSDIGGLVDTRFTEFDFPDKPNVEGLNAADSLTIVVEKRGKNPGFSDDEKQELLKFLQQSARIVFGKELPARN